jgi:two-component system response regulator HupR/HoxA
MQNEIMRMLALARGPLLGPDLLTARVGSAAGGAAQATRAPPANGAGTLQARMAGLEAQLLEEALVRHRWNKSRAAAELGLSRVGLRGKLARYGLERK